MRGVCSVPTCNRFVVGRGLCGAHYQRVRSGRSCDAPLTTRHPQYESAACCSISGCSRSPISRGMCRAHYRRSQLGKDMSLPVKRRNKGESCSVESCTFHAESLGFCRTHYMRIHRGNLVGNDRIYHPSRPTSDHLTKERLHQLLTYLPETGVFYWNRTEGGHRVEGRRAGATSKIHGYREVRIDGVLYKEHRLVILYVTGEWPHDEVDHRDLSRAANGLDNLRGATSSQNMCNRRVRSDSASGMKNIQFREGVPMPWRVRVSINKVLHNIGSFASLSEAIEARRQAVTELHGEFGRVE